MALSGTQGVIYQSADMRQILKVTLGQMTCRFSSNVVTGAAGCVRTPLSGRTRAKRGDVRKRCHNSSRELKKAAINRADCPLNSQICHKSWAAQSHKVIRRRAASRLYNNSTGCYEGEQAGCG